MSDHGTDLATTGHGDEPQFPLPPHHARRSDTDPRAAKAAERQVAIMFGLSAVLTIAFVVVYFAFPPNQFVDLGPAGVVQTSSSPLPISRRLSRRAGGAGRSGGRSRTKA